MSSSISSSPSSSSSSPSPLLASSSSFASPSSSLPIHLSFSPFRSGVQDVLAGTIGGMCTVLVGHPLDTMKVRLQSGATNDGLMACLRSTFKSEGVRGFYKGMQSPLAGEGFFNASQFLVYGASKRYLLQRRIDDDTIASTSSSTSSYRSSSLSSSSLSSLSSPIAELRLIDYYIAGAVTGSLCTFVESPIDFFKSQLQVQYALARPRFTTLAGVVVDVWREGGVRGVYQGLGATLMRTGPATAAYFGVYETVKSSLLMPGQSKATLTDCQLLLAGGCAGTSFWLSSFPADSIKSAMQTDATDRRHRRYASIIDCTKQLWREDGIRRFYRGLAPCLIRAFPANAACFVAYENALRWMEKM